MRNPLPNHQAHAKDVCIIGAGISGLRAAHILSDPSLGFNVTILEARDRPGGRVYQTADLGLPVDLGATWIHGTEGNPIAALAKKIGCSTVSCGAVYSICDASGNWLDRQVARQRYEEVWDILEKAMEHSMSHRESIPDNAKMMDFFCDELESKSKSQPDPDSYISLMRQIGEMWGAFMGDDWQRQSLKNVWLEAGLEGDNLFMASTYKGILDFLLETTRDKCTLRLNCEVTSIISHSPDVVQVDSTDGFSAVFGQVIVTTPLGWLKRNHDAFYPPLPPKISNAIQSLGYGNLDKVFIKFPQPFWNDKIGQPSMDDQYANTAAEPAFPIESLFLQPEYSQNTNPAKWRTEIISYSGLPDQYAQPIIMFFVYGQWGRHVTGLVRGTKPDSEEYRRILYDLFHPYFSKLPNYDPASANCQPSDFLLTDWQNDKFAGHGSFTNEPVGSGDCSQYSDALRKGMGEERKIWFAGEHTSPPGGVGTVAGAYWSGEEAARKVASSHGLRPSSST
ncbi:hypothetical protein B0I35DRAFT_363495 [Stachybotrys elegans]|uniref:Amine oxidase n=1 Tax=Stachybotrys elegans TaxID=80388 RepID=A0A8K0SHU9_9HYPO|nr:hypothetical protein B0I35DRAFT_363495 [Stachybotrys elegans]